MNANVGKWDAWVRGGLAVVCLVAAGMFVDSLLVSLLAALCGVILAATALTHNCPFYSFFRIDTRRDPHMSHR
jgi:hypothetical protein